MLTFLLRPVGILCLSSGLLVMAQFGGDLSPRMNQAYLTPFHIKNRNVGLKVEGSSFTLDGSPFLIIAGTIHYFRVPREYWRDRLLKLKACGFNTLTTHIPWNLHEPRKGWFYFTANLDFMYVLMWRPYLWPKDRGLTLRDQMNKTTLFSVWRIIRKL